MAGEWSALHERAAIVAAARKEANLRHEMADEAEPGPMRAYNFARAVAINAFADAIERGDHLPPAAASPARINSPGSEDRPGQKGSDV